MNTIYAVLMCMSAATAGGPCYNVFGDLTFVTRRECGDFFREHWHYPADIRDAHYGCYALTAPAWMRVD